MKPVLVIDDDAFVRTVVTQQVRRLGLPAIMAADGTAARQALRGQPLHAVVCDLKMPGVDGIELLRDFGELQPDAGIVLMSSADSRTLAAAEQVAKARQLRILGTLQKPVSASELKALLDQVDAIGAPAKRCAPVLEVPVDALRAAIAAGEIDVHVQPKVDLESGRLMGVEALARWVKPDGTTILPDAFIGVAHRAGLMDDLTDLIVRQALSAWSGWRAEGLVIDIAINLPIESLDQLDLPDRLSCLAERFDVPPQRIVLEVTETGVMRDLARSLDVVTRLRLRGYHLSVDDFGTGYSSLEQLKRFPFTELKLDRAFVDGASRDVGLRTIAESSLRLARDLNLESCAEGVETQADYELMRALGCTLVQGYYIARPMPKDRLADWAAQRAKRR